MNKQKLEEDIKKRRTSPYFSNSYTASPSIPIEQLATLSDFLIAVGNRNKTNSFCCSSPQKYKNGMGRMIFWSCKNCGADLGDIND